MSVSGINSYAQYGLQSNFATALSAGAGDRVWGKEQEFTPPELDESMFALGDLNTPLVQKFAFGKFYATFSVDWVLSNPWWIDGVLGLTSSSGSSPTTHTWDDSKTVNAYTAELGINTSTDRVIQLQRCVVGDVKVSGSIDDTVKCRGNYQVGKTEATAGTSLDGSVVADDVDIAYTMVHGTVENPSSTILAEIQNFELNLNPNIKYSYGIDTTSGEAGFAQNAYKGRLDITGSFELSIKDNTWWNNVRARTEPTNNTLRLKFTNGGAGAAERSMQFTMTGLGLGKHSSKLPKYELATETIPFTARDITVVAVNSVSAVP